MRTRIRAWERTAKNRLALLLVMLSFFSVPALAQKESGDLAKQLQNPLAHLITNIHVAECAGGIEMFSRGIFPIDSNDGGVGHRVFYGSYYDKVTRTSEGWRISYRVFSAKRKA